MSQNVDGRNKIAFAEFFWLGILLLLVIITRIYFLDMGFGRPDAWRVGDTGKFLVTLGEYFPSRPPGFPLLELVSALSYLIFSGSDLTWIFTNALTAMSFCVSVVGVWTLARMWGSNSPLLVAAVYSFAPLNWVYSVETIDYLWMTSLIILAVIAIEKNGKYSPIWVGALLGLATSARFFAAFQLIPLGILLWTKRKSISSLVYFFISFLAVTASFYLIVFLQVEDWSEYKEWFDSLNKVQSRLAQVEGGTFLKRFLMPATGLFGPLASMGVLLGFIRGFRKLIEKLKTRNSGMWAASIMAFFIMAPYLWHLHPNYWIPATGFILIILGTIIDIRGFAIMSLLIFLANFPIWQSNVEGLRFLSPKGKNRAIENYAATIARFQNESVFQEMTVRQLIWADTENLLEIDLPENSIVMSILRLPIIQFIEKDMEPIELELSNERMIVVWGAKSGGPYFKYFLSPSQVKDAIESGYHAVYLPGMESTYYAEFGVEIQDVEGVEVLYYDPAR